MKSKIKYFVVIAVCGVFASCAKKLNLFPQNDLTSQQVYSTAAGYKSVLAKLYGTLSITGNQGPAGAPDIAGGLDEGSQVAFIRMFFNCEELPTDEAVVAWNDQTIHDFHNLSWTKDDPFLKGIYARCIYDVTLINEYLRESTDDKLASRGITGSDADDIKKSRAEARFLRAYNYWVMLDLFGKSTFITEADGIGTFLPKEISRTDLYNYIESELKAIDADLGTPKSAEYGRVDQAAEWCLLARLYLNAEVYTGTAQWANALTYAKKVIDAGYSLTSDYKLLFMADNDKQTNEIIWAINCDGLHTQAYGNTTFFVHAACGDDHDQYGVSGGWNGYRATKALGDLFPDLTGNTDKRAMFTTSVYGTSSGQQLIADVSDFNNGLHVKKYVNIRSDGGPISDVTANFSDVDFPVFRLSEMYLIYAEAYLRGGGGDAATALDYMNKIRFRAYGGSYGPGNVGKLNSTDLTLQTILDERGRELYWEGFRRTDLIRYKLLTSATYLWPWKGGVASGTAVDDKYNLFAIPQTNISSNTNLTQNTGY
ncbi:MAG TPA: RagB/SusD family nutrient uptake outer membrane protein [Chitinophagaceae bacterium]|nr:RagB/SusD family nutrient uptake outer membrane protein [Chitinophagaceae bacterium]